MRQVWHPWHQWECYHAGMFDGATELSPEEGKQRYAEFLRDIPRFEAAMAKVLELWPKSCEHFLSNPSMNRVAWLGQAAMCMDSGLSRRFRAGFSMMEDHECRAANRAAEAVLKKWITEHEGKNTAARRPMEAPRLFA